MIGYSLPNYDNWLSKPYDSPAKMTEEQIREEAEEIIAEMSIEEIIQTLRTKDRDYYKEIVKEIKEIAIQNKIDELTK